MALKGRCAALLGVDNDPDVCAQALADGAVDQASSLPAEILPQADLVILATPVSSILTYLDRLPALHPGPALVMDCGSTKLEICQAMQRLPASWSALGGHPMCGKEKGGYQQAEASLFQGAVFALVRLSNSSDQAAALAEALVVAVGARPFWVEAAIHDRWVAATSHFPYLLSAMLARLTPPEARPLIGPGWRSTARLAGSSPRMMADILKSNRQPILAQVRAAREQLAALESWLEVGDWVSLSTWLADIPSTYLAHLPPNPDESSSI
jgi:prephenate dehydrogenase